MNKRNKSIEYLQSVISYSHSGNPRETVEQVFHINACILKIQVIDGHVPNVAHGAEFGYHRTDLVLGLVNFDYVWHALNFQNKPDVPKQIISP